jgi:triosephosphate isomerase
MNSKMIIGNWKMNGSIELLQTFSNTLNDQNLVLAIPYPLISIAKNINPKAKIAAQDCSVLEGKGAYTGEISASILAECGTEYAIIGHSERRQLFNESGETIRQKIKNSILAGLKVVYCVDENFENQIKKELDNDLEKPTMIAYEPVSAIGTGLTPSAELVSQIASNIKNIITTKVVYGGSVSANNANTFLNINNIDGILVGGASLKLNEIEQILKFNRNLNSAL